MPATNLWESLPNWGAALFCLTLKCYHQMKTLNEKALQILTNLLTMKPPITIDAEGNTKEVYAKVVQDFGRYRIITLTYNQDIEGYLLREPEVTIIYDRLAGEYIPSNICYDFERVNSNSASVYHGQLTVWNEKMQTDHTEIANDLLCKLGDQL